jgi:hypothetical protein
VEGVGVASRMKEITFEYHVYKQSRISTRATVPVIDMEKFRAYLPSASDPAKPPPKVEGALTEGSTLQHYVIGASGGKCASSCV